MRSGFGRAAGALGALGIAVAVGACTFGTTYDPPPATEVCKPVDLPSFAAKWIPFRTATCPPEALASFDAGCGSEATVADCDAFLRRLDADCAACLQSSERDPTWGARVRHSPQDRVTFANAAGCVAHAEDDPDGSPCALAILAEHECVRAACDRCPNAGSDHPEVDLTTCEDAAAELPTCKAALDAAGTACARSDAALRACGIVNGGDPAAAARQVLCGGGP